MGKIVKKKRIILYCPWTGEEIIGGEEYDGALSDNNIFVSFHELGKTIWRSTEFGYKELWYLREQNGVRVPTYKVGIDDFYVEVPTFWDKLKKVLR